MSTSDARAAAMLRVMLQNFAEAQIIAEEAENRNHHVEVIDPLECDLIIEKENNFKDYWTL